MWISSSSACEAPLTCSGTYLLGTGKNAQGSAHCDGRVVFPCVGVCLWITQPPMQQRQCQFQDVLCGIGAIRCQLSHLEQVGIRKRGREITLTKSRMREKDAGQGHGFLG